MDSSENVPGLGPMGATLEKTTQLGLDCQHSLIGFGAAREQSKMFAIHSASHFLITLSNELIMGLKSNFHNAANS